MYVDAVPRPPEAPGRDRVAVVITAYNPDDALVQACRSVLHQAGTVVVVDDGSDALDERLFDQCNALGVVVVRHGTNRGIGAALNTGVRAVWDRPDDGSRPAYILTLDQDSVVPDGYVDALVGAEQAAVQAGITVGMVGPELAGRIRSAVAHEDRGIVYSREPIQSGLLVPQVTFDAIGLFAEDLFIDGVDSEFYLRAMTYGRPAIVARGTRLSHSLGSEHVVRLLGRPLHLVHAADFRYYYITRNRVILVRRYARRAPGWACTAVLRDIRHLLVTTAFVPGRRGRLANVVAGLRDGVGHVTGQRPRAG